MRIWARPRSRRWLRRFPGGNTRCGESSRSHTKRARRSPGARRRPWPVRSGAWRGSSGWTRTDALKPPQGAARIQERRVEQGPPGRAQAAQGPGGDYGLSHRSGPGRRGKSRPEPQPLEQPAGPLPSGRGDLRAGGPPLRLQRGGRSGRSRLPRAGTSGDRGRRVGQGTHRSPRRQGDHGLGRPHANSWRPVPCCPPWDRTGR